MIEHVQHRALNLKLRQIKGTVMSTYCKSMFCSGSVFVIDCEDTRKGSSSSHKKCSFKYGCKNHPLLSRLIAILLNSTDLVLKSFTSWGGRGGAENSGSNEAKIS